jgi:hypothetical protein
MSMMRSLAGVVIAWIVLSCTGRCNSGWLSRLSRQGYERVAAGDHDKQA